MQILALLKKFGYKEKDALEFEAYFDRFRKSEFDPIWLESRLNEIFDYFKKIHVPKQKVLVGLNLAKRFIFTDIQTLDRHLDDWAGFLNLSKSEVAVKLMRSPHIMKITIQKVQENVAKSARLFKLSEARVTRAFLRYPSLFGVSPETLYNNVCQNAVNLGCKKSEVVASFVKQPALFSLKPENINTFVEKAVSFLEVDKSFFVKKFLGYPSIFSRNPENLFQNIKRFSLLLQKPVFDVVSELLKAPQVMMLSPESVLKKQQELALFFQVKPSQIPLALTMMRVQSVQEKYAFYHKMYMQDLWRLVGDEVVGENNQIVVQKDVQRLNHVLLKNMFFFGRSAFDFKLREAYALLIKHQNKKGCSPMHMKHTDLVQRLNGADAVFKEQNKAIFQLIKSKNERVKE